MLAGTVIDKPKLKRLFGAITSAIITLYTVLLGLANHDSHSTLTPSPVPAPTPVLGACIVNAVQQATIRSVMLGGAANATTCDYNTTLNELLRASPPRL
eukprot:COSAG01_NODE_792_length_13554_cov_13.811891_15_plen_99_part_00